MAPRQWHGVTGGRTCSGPASPTPSLPMTRPSSRAGRRSPMSATGLIPDRQSAVPMTDLYREDGALSCITAFAAFLVQGRFRWTAHRGSGDRPSVLAVAVQQFLLLSHGCADPVRAGAWPCCADQSEDEGRQGVPGHLFQPGGDRDGGHLRSLDFPLQPRCRAHQPAAGLGDAGYFRQSQLAALYPILLDIPRDFDEAAAIDGATPFQACWTIFLPSSRPVIASVAILRI